MVNTRALLSKSNDDIFKTIQQELEVENIHIDDNISASNLDLTEYNFGNLLLKGLHGSFFTNT